MLEHQANHPSGYGDYTLDDTAMTPAAQAAFGRMADANPSHEPDDVHHLADVLHSLRDSAHQDLEIRKAAGLYQESQAAILGNIIDRSEGLIQHYVIHHLQYRQLERDQWARLLEATASIMPEYDIDDVDDLIHQLDNPANTYETLSAVYQPENTVLVAPPAVPAIDYARDIPFTNDPQYQTIHGQPDAYDVRDKHIVGTIPADPEARATTVTNYRVKYPQPDGWTIDRNGQYAPLYDQPITRDLLTYTVQEDPRHISHFQSKDATMVTDDPDQLAHWRRTGVIEYDQPVYIVTTDPTLEDRWRDDNAIDFMTTVLTIEPTASYDSWRREVPPDAQVVYTAIPESDAARLVDDRHILGEIPPELRVRAQTYTTWPKDHHTETYGQPVTLRATLLLRTRLDPLEPSG